MFIIETYGLKLFFYLYSCQMETDIPHSTITPTWTTPQPNHNRSTTASFSTESTTITKRTIFQTLIALELNDSINNRKLVPVPECNGPGYHQANKCNEYYECVPTFWWYQPMLRSCAKGFFFSTGNKKPCDKPPHVICFF